MQHDLAFETTLITNIVKFYICKITMPWTLKKLCTHKINGLFALKALHVQKPYTTITQCATPIFTSRELKISEHGHLWNKHLKLQ